ncbi:unnamed protein product [Allacma fusca]|uniref:Uncharacterized protein n=1 Tax=Allacma fusca TaxID=39272 RepID=A0A8J2PF48_9HEXA|nr:unnamed protein product [Allacma fusca]
MLSIRRVGPALNPTMNLRCVVYWTKLISKVTICYAILKGLSTFGTYGKMRLRQASATVFLEKNSTSCQRSAMLRNLMSMDTERLLRTWVYFSNA